MYTYIDISKNNGEKNLVATTFYFSPSENSGTKRMNWIPEDQRARCPWQNCLMMCLPAAERAVSFNQPACKHVSSHSHAELPSPGLVPSQDHCYLRRQSHIRKHLHYLRNLRTGSWLELGSFNLGACE